MNLIKLNDLRNKKLETISKYKDRISKLKKNVEEIEQRLLEHCDHPSSHQKLLGFDEGVQDEGVWLCTICNQVKRTRDYNPVSEEEMKAAFEQIYKNMYKQMGIPYESADNR